MFNVYGVPCKPNDDPSLKENTPSGGGGAGSGSGSFNPKKV
jgi:hypothetical protein